jgi:hypothetical protein
MVMATGGKYQAREAWLASAMGKFRPQFSACGFEIPERVRVSCGWPSEGGLRGSRRRVGEAWSSKSSRDQHYEVFISPTLQEPATVLGVLAHELVHCAVGLECGHKGRFPLCARAVGLVGKMTSTEPSDEFLAKLKSMAGLLGKYPHASLDRMTNGRKKQGTRLIKVCCLGCLYTLRGTMTWLLLGIPNCPNDDCDDCGKQMDVEWPEA